MKIEKGSRKSKENINVLCSAKARNNGTAGQKKIFVADVFGVAVRSKYVCTFVFRLGEEENNRKCSTDPKTSGSWRASLVGIEKEN